MTIITVLLSFLVSLFLTACLRKYALDKNVIDIPNARSSHVVPTPRGGGVAIVITFLAGLLILYLMGMMSFLSMLPIFASGLIIALIGFLDDHGHIAARWRLLAHFIAAFIFLIPLKGLPDIQIWQDVSIKLSIFGYLLGAFFLVWMLNLYNFMDGIDGIASVEAITTCLFGITIYVVSQNISDNSLTLPLWILLGAVAGFLFWNFPPARIFMGDAGSGFLGFILGAFVLQASWLNTDLLFSWLILLGVFIVDATWTLLRRLLKGDKVYEAHRSHAYQILSRRFKRHLPVTLGVIVINTFWLFPIALWVSFGGINPILALFIAYLPLIIAAIQLKAGLENN